MQSLKDLIIVLLSGPLVLPVVNTLCKWNPEMCGLLCLTAFAKHPISRLNCVAAACACICKCVCCVSASVGVGCNAHCSCRVARRGHRVLSLLTSLRPDLSLNLELKLYWLDWELEGTRFSCSCSPLFYKLQECIGGLTCYVSASIQTVVLGFTQKVLVTTELPF